VGEPVRDLAIGGPGQPLVRERQARAVAELCGAASSSWPPWDQVKRAVLQLIKSFQLIVALDVNCTK
jgi:hypothetical protein